MPGISRSFRKLARNLGRVGIGEESFTSPKTIQPTLNAERFDPSPHFGLEFSGANAGALNVWHVQMFVPTGHAVTDIYLQSFQTQELYYWVHSSEGVTTPGVVVGTSLTDGQPSQVDVQRAVGVPTASPPRPAVPIRLFLVTKGIIQLAPLVGPVRLELEQFTVNQALNVNLWWREVNPAG